MSYNVVNYNERFYDVYGINSNLVANGKVPSLVDLESIPVLDSIDYEVILDNRAADMELRKLEEKVHLISTEHQAPRVGALLSFFADIVVNKMGGPVNDAEEMARRVVHCFLLNSLNQSPDNIGEQEVIGKKLSGDVPCSMKLNTSVKVLPAQKQGQLSTSSNESSPPGNLFSKPMDSGYVLVRGRPD
ncbi:hypothetical protein ACH5RR_041213 [Cinchona calisaya]|uniref:EDR1/CTR1/ARMC3-like peptidase-like domain-containing protein n=1 Tax=Cinchona calisaya TaxID=153742 RepID=A0ABD2XUU1_9GENT